MARGTSIRRVVGVVLGGALLALACAAPSTAAVGAAAVPCKAVDAVFARGSGQGLDAGEADRFHTQIDSRLTAYVLHNFYELGGEAIGGHQYPAVPVGVDSWEHGITTLGAKVSNGGGLKYGKSVDEGVGELAAYIGARSAKCPDTLFILGGYSQGAQVVGETYVEKLTRAQRDHVVFAALFGDPKLYLPEGESVLWWDAPACKGKDYSEWRRTVPNCDTDNGSLAARKPYLPASWTSSTGLWCADKDFICGSSKSPLVNSGHETYGKNGDTDAAVREAVSRLKGRLGSDGDNLELSLGRPAAGQTGLDVVFVMDSTSSMTFPILWARPVASTLANYVSTVNGRVALVEYRDAGDDFTARVLSNLQEGTADFEQKLIWILPEGGGDPPEALLRALKTAIDRLGWREGATKAAIVLTDADYHDPDLVDGTTLDDIAALSLSLDPLNVYPVVPHSLATRYKAVADATAGQVVEITDGVPAALEEALDKIRDRPVAQFALNGYYGRPGSTIHFDGSRSYSPTSTIVKWDFDFDGDGTYEILGGSSSADHTYRSAFDGVAQLRVTDANGLVANASVPVHIGTPPAPTTVPAKSVSVTGHGSTATLSWVADTDPGKAWAIFSNGYHIALIDPKARSVEITDIDRSEDVEFAVAPFSADSEVGRRVAAVLPAERSAASPEPTRSSSPSPSTGVIGSVPTANGGAGAGEARGRGATVKPTAAPATGAEAAATAPSDGPLAHTGTSIMWAAAGAGAACVSAGALVTVLARRRRG